MSAALEIRDLRRQFGGLRAVDDLSFDVRAGELVGLIGPNGSGKTTTMNLISGALKPTSGRIALDGQPISGLPPHKIARLGISRTFQLVRVLPMLDAERNVAAGAIFGLRDAWGQEAVALARELLARVGLTHRAGVPVSAMTYIDQKRIELARALAADPKVLLLDEWHAGLNPTELRIRIELIEGLAAEGHTIVMVEHVMDAIRALCSRCVVMSSGRKIAEGGVDEVLSDADVVWAFLGDEEDA